MGMFDQMKMAADMMKNMDPKQLQQMMEQAQKGQEMLAAQIRKAVGEEISRRGLVTKAEVEAMMRSLR